MKNQKYTIKLSGEERQMLNKFIRSTSKKNTEQCKVHAKVLLALDENRNRPLSPEQTSKKCKLHVENVYKIRKQFCTEGLDRVLNRKKRETPPVPPKITGDVEAYIIATACSEIPEGHEHWTLSMISKKIILDGVIDSISNEAVRLVLKKHNSNLI